MANFLLVIDSNSPRRHRFIRTAFDRVAPVTGLERGWLECGDCSIVWAMGRGTPSSQRTQDGSVTLLLGDALDDTGHVDAARLSQLWQRSDGPTPDALDGYFAGLVHDSRKGVCVGADLLGMFPVYHFERDGALLVASSPDLFLPHPLFPRTISAEGLAGILLTNGLVNDRPLPEGVCRLKAGHLLRWQTTGPVREEPQYSLPVSDRFRHVSHLELERVVESTFEEVLGRHAPDTETALLLSGGLDSRLVAGYLTRRDVRPAALCLGLPTDLEMLAARRVTSALGLQFHCQAEEPDDQTYLQLANRTARCEMLSAGFGVLDMWSAAPALADLAPRFWSGLMLDDLLGGYAFSSAFDPATGAWSFDRLSQKLMSWGMPLDQLSDLLRPLGGRELAHDVFASFRQMFECGAGWVWQKAFRTKLATRCRFHLGAGLWRMSFGSWPIAPFLDRRLLELAIDLPPTLVLNRQLERRLLSQRFSALAKISLDDGTLKFRPVTPSLAGRIASVASRAIPRPVRNRLRWGMVERRRYYRHFDLNRSHWKAIRRHAEPHRDRLTTWLDGRVVDQILPPPETPIALRDPYGPGASRRSLLGLMLCSQRLSASVSRPVPATLRQTASEALPASALSNLRNRVPEAERKRGQESKVQSTRRAVPAFDS